MSSRWFSWRWYLRDWEPLFWGTHTPDLEIRPLLLAHWGMVLKWHLPAQPMFLWLKAHMQTHFSCCFVNSLLPQEVDVRTNRRILLCNSHTSCYNPFPLACPVFPDADWNITLQYYPQVFCIPQGNILASGMSERSGVRGIWDWILFVSKLATLLKEGSRQQFSPL